MAPSGAAGENGALPLSRRDLLATWASAAGLLLAARLLSLVEPTGLLAANLGGVAALLFVWLPDRRLRARGEGWDSCGLPWWGALDRRTWAAWGRGAARALAVAAVAFPLFALGFAAFARALPLLPPGLRSALAPYELPPAFSPRLPPGLALQAAIQLLVVALPEEVLYRGFLQTSWRRAVPGRTVRVLGADLGPGFLATQALFALGHLATLQPWRLGTFFPGLLFGWLRERSGDLAAPVVLHALSNLFLLALEASFYGR
ncbi:MAG TPA: MXAN_2755 family glutamic-type intramembrane protease [Anaeromyxobacteraceae bacterium]